MRVVITGSVGVGKTTAINLLEDLEYPVVHEVARDLMDNIGLKKEYDIDNYDWQDIVEAKQIVNYDANKYAFFDRGIVDEIAFRRFRNMKIPMYLRNKAKTMRYDKAIIIYPPHKDVWHNNNPESLFKFNEVMQLHYDLLRAYEKYNYDMLHIMYDDMERVIKDILSSF